MYVNLLVLWDRLKQINCKTIVRASEKEDKKHYVKKVSSEERYGNEAMRRT